MAAGGNGKVGTKQVIDYMRLALELDGEDVYQVEVTGDVGTASTGASIVVADDAAIARAVDAFVKPDKNARDSSVDQLAGKPSSGSAKQLTPPAKMAVEVRNGNGADGAARAAATGIEGLGYPVTVQNGTNGAASRSNFPSTVVMYTNEDFKDEAEELADSFDGGTAQKATGEAPFSTRLLVIVGKRGSTVSSGASAGQGTTDTADSNKVPAKAPPNVTTDREYGIDDFRAIKHDVKFPVMFPTVRERSSTYDILDDGRAVRAYKVAKGNSVYDAYRLVAVTGGMGAYWGLQGTNWPDPPILEDPTREVTAGGRKYLLFFNGTRLHVVGWREGGGTYWVTNTVLDDLSNETMLAIAKGARPLTR
jgi:hypothetical protein